MLARILKDLLKQLDATQLSEEEKAVRDFIAENVNATIPLFENDDNIIHRDLVVLENTEMNQFKNLVRKLFGKLEASEPTQDITFYRLLLSFVYQQNYPINNNASLSDLASELSQGLEFWTTKEIVNNNDEIDNNYKRFYPIFLTMLNRDIVKLDTEDETWFNILNEELIELYKEFYQENDEQVDLSKMTSTEFVFLMMLLEKQYKANQQLEQFEIFLDLMKTIEDTYEGDLSVEVDEDLSITETINILDDKEMTETDLKSREKGKENKEKENDKSNEIDFGLRELQSDQVTVSADLSQELNAKNNIRVQNDKYESLVNQYYLCYNVNNEYVFKQIVSCLSDNDTFNAMYQAILKPYNLAPETLDLKQRLIEHYKNNYQLMHDEITKLEEHIIFKTVSQNSTLELNTVIQDAEHPDLILSDPLQSAQSANPFHEQLSALQRCKSRLTARGDSEKDDLVYYRNRTIIGLKELNRSRGNSSDLQIIENDLGNAFVRFFKRAYDKVASALGFKEKEAPVYENRKYKGGDDYRLWKSPGYYFRKAVNQVEKELKLPSKKRKSG